MIPAISFLIPFVECSMRGRDGDWLVSFVWKHRPIVVDTVREWSCGLSVSILPVCSSLTANDCVGPSFPSHCVSSLPSSP